MDVQVMDDAGVRRIMGLRWQGWLYVGVMSTAAVAHLAFADTIVPYYCLMVLGLPLSLFSYACLFFILLILDSALGSGVQHALGASIWVAWWTVTAWGNALVYRGIRESVRARRQRGVAREPVSSST
jgi:hypothetical protein